MKNRPQPKKISFIKVSNNKTYNKNKNKKYNNTQNNNLLFLNSPKKIFTSSTNKHNEKLYDKMKRYSLEAYLLNQVIINRAQNRNKDNNNNDELKYNSLDNKNTAQRLRCRNNNNKICTDRCTNPFIKMQNSLNINIKENVLTNTISNENSIKRNTIRNNQILRCKNVNKKLRMGAFLSFCFF